jgi:hypothetical protein
MDAKNFTLLIGRLIGGHSKDLQKISKYPLPNLSITRQTKTVKITCCIRPPPYAPAAKQKKRHLSTFLIAPPQSQHFTALKL